MELCSEYSSVCFKQCDVIWLLKESFQMKLLNSDYLKLMTMSMWVQYCALLAQKFKGGELGKADLCDQEWNGRHVIASGDFHIRNFDKLYKKVVHRSL